MNFDDQVQTNDSQLFEPIINGVDFVHNQQMGQFMSTPNDRAIRLNDFLPEDKNLFYRYDGSLTTPSCAESVTWLIFDHSYPIGKDQVSLLQIN